MDNLIGVLLVMKDLTELKEKALAATSGEWRHIEGDSFCAYPHIIIGDKHWVFEDHSEDYCKDLSDNICHTHGNCGCPSEENNAAYIAVANPQTILELIEEIELLRERNKILEMGELNETNNF